MKDRDIRAFRQLDVYRIVLAEVAVVLGEPSAEATRFGANNGITTGIVAGRPVEDFQPDQVLLNAFALAGQGLADYETQEAGVARRLGKKRRAEDSLKLSFDEFTRR